MNIDKILTLDCFAELRSSLCSLAGKSGLFLGLGSLVGLGLCCTGLDRVGFRAICPRAWIAVLEGGISAALLRTRGTRRCRGRSEGQSRLLFGRFARCHRISAFSAFAGSKRSGGNLLAFICSNIKKHQPCSKRYGITLPLRGL